MKSLIQYLFEGGASGHMAHPYDYAEFTLRDLKGLIRNLFTGRIEDMTEKIDGTNIQATMNDSGTVVFIRNQKDLNSEIGGMTIADMADKWAGKPRIAQTFLTAGDTITKVFERIGPRFFNPSPDKRLVVNCECVIAGKTNAPVLPMCIKYGKKGFRRKVWISVGEMIPAEHIALGSDDRTELRRVSNLIMDNIKMLMDGMSEYGDPLPKQYVPKIEKQSEEENK